MVDTLHAGEFLVPGGATLTGGDYTLALTPGDEYQPDNVALQLLHSSGRVVWSPVFRLPGVMRAALEQDGDFVLYVGDDPREAIWSTGTTDRDVDRLTVHPDGYVGLYNRDGILVWRSLSEQGGDTLYAGETLDPQAIPILVGGAYNLTLNGDGDLRLFYYYTGEIVWTPTHRHTGATSAVLREDGEFVLYRGAPGPSTQVWSTRTAGRDVDRLIVHPDGSAGLYARNGTLVWQAPHATPDNTLYLNEILIPGNTLTDKVYTLTLTVSGDLRLIHSATGLIVWTPTARNTGAARASLEGDGNLVLQTDHPSPYTEIWSTGTGGRQIDRITVQSRPDDAYIGMFANDGALVWRSERRRGSVDGGDTLYLGDTLVAGRPGLSSGGFTLAVTATGRLELRDSAGARVWMPDTVFGGWCAGLNSHGSFAFYNDDPDPFTEVWSTGTPDRGVDRLALHPEGYLALHTHDGTEVWRSGSS